MKTYSHNLFCEFLGHSPETKIMEHLFEIKGSQFTFNDIVSSIHINRKRAYEILHFLLDEGFIQEVQKIKNITLYQLNLRSPEVKSLKNFFDKMISS